MSTTTAKVLLVNLSAHLRASLSISPEGGRPPYGVRTAGNLQEALTVLTEDDFFAVLIAVETAETVGDHLLKEIRAGYPNIEISALFPEGAAALANQIPAELQVRVLHQPIDTGALIEHLGDQASERDTGFAGTLKNIQIDDLIQMCCLSMATLSIRVARDNHCGIVFIREGEVVHAVCGDIAGEEAFYRILGWARGRFETIGERYDGENTVNKSHEFLLMEAARRNDEGTPPDRDAATSLAEPGGSVSGALKVLLVEDSTLMAKILSSMLTATGAIHVVGTARNGQDALQMAQSLLPDLILLDVNMPVMDGSTALKHIMIRTPCPVVVMSNVGSGSPEAVLRFLDLGAVDFMAKPVKNKDLLLQQHKIVTRVTKAAAANIHNTRRYRSAPERTAKKGGEAMPASPADQLAVILAGCSGHGELIHLLAQLPDDHNLATVILEAIPPAFIPALANHLDRQSALRVRPLVHGQPLRTGTCYLGTPGHALRATSTGRETVLEMPPHCQKSHREASYLDLFLCSAADCYPGSMLVAVLSGADTGNLEGIRYVAAQGARILVQDPATCAMAEPSAVLVEAGLAGGTAGPETMADHIRHWARGMVQA